MRGASIIRPVYKANLEGILSRTVILYLWSRGNPTKSTERFCGGGGVHWPANGWAWFEKKKESVHYLDCIYCFTLNEGPTAVLGRKGAHDQKKLRTTPPQIEQCPVFCYVLVLSYTNIELITQLFFSSKCVFNFLTKKTKKLGNCSTFLSTKLTVGFESRI